MTLNLDKKDYQILYELDKNSRAPLSTISKKVKLSRESVLYRIRKYFKNGVIRNYLTVVDVSRFGFTHHKVLLKLHNIKEEKEKEFIKYLIKNKNIAWISSCDGSYSLMFVIRSKNLKEFYNILMEINNRYSKYISKQIIASIVEANYFHRDYLIEQKQTTKRKIGWDDDIKSKIKLDDADKKILHELAKNTRATSVEISKKVNLSPDTVIQRIKKYEREKIIDHYLIWINVNKVIGLYYKVLIRLKNINKEKEDDIFNYCNKIPKIVFLLKTIGEWQLELDLEVKNVIEYRGIIRDLLNNFSDVIIDYTGLNIYQEYKYNLFEKEILD